MKTSPERSSSLDISELSGMRISRGLAPAASQAWLVQEEPSTTMNRLLGDWLKSVSEAEGLFKKHVYDNDNFSGADMRQHRGLICALVSDGEMLVMEITTLAQKTGLQKEAKPMVEVIDQKMKKLFDELIAWHAPLAAQADIPEDLKASIQELEEGKVVDMDI